MLGEGPGFELLVGRVRRSTSPILRKNKVVPYKEGILKDIDAHVGYTIIYRRGGYLSGGTSLDPPRGRYTRAVTSSTAKGL